MSEANGPIAARYEGYKWVKVKRHKDDPTKPWEERYADLEKHHIEETTFLIEEIRRLAKEFDEFKRPKSVQERLEWMKENWGISDEELAKLFQ